MDKLPGKIGLYLLMLLIVAASLTMKGADANTGGGAPGSGDEHSHEGEDVPPGIPVLLEFTSPTCDICKQMHPMIDKLRAEYAGRVAIVEILVNNKEAQELADSYGVEAFPSFFLLNNKDEKIVLEHFEGGFPEEMFRKLFEEAPNMKPSIPPAGGEGADPHGATPGGGTEPMAAPGGGADPHGATAPAGEKAAPAAPAAAPSDAASQHGAAAPAAK